MLLDGWGYQDTHETLNSFIWGPDGWLYGCHGVFTHSQRRQAGHARRQAHADQRRHLALSSRRGTSSKSSPTARATPGASTSTTTARPSPPPASSRTCSTSFPAAATSGRPASTSTRYTYDDIKTIADHRHYIGNQWNDGNRRQSDTLGGGHAHAGAMIYHGGAWPEKYRGQLFMNNIHGNRMNVDHARAARLGYVGHHGPDFLLTSDQWSQMLYMTYGPDGQVYVIDWYDTQPMPPPRTRQATTAATAGSTGSSTTTPSR